MKKKETQLTLEENIIGWLVTLLAVVFVLLLCIIGVKVKSQSELLMTIIDRADSVSGASANHETRLYDVQMKIESMENILSELSGSISFLQERRHDMLTDIERNKTDVRAILRNKYNCTWDLYFANTTRDNNETDVTSLMYWDIDDLYISDRQYNREILCLDKLQFSKHFIRYQ